MTLRTVSNGRTVQVNFGEAQEVFSHTTYKITRSGSVEGGTELLLYEIKQPDKNQTPNKYFFAIYY